MIFPIHRNLILKVIDGTATGAYHHGGDYSFRKACAIIIHQLLRYLVTVSSVKTIIENILKIILTFNTKSSSIVN